MPKTYSGDLRERVVEAVASGASRREAAELYEIAASTAVKWLQRLRETGSAAAKPRGGSTSPLEEHAAVILALVEERPDATYEEMLAALVVRQIKSSRGALWRFFARHRITRKKKSLRAAEQKRADVAQARRRWIRDQGLLAPPGWFLSMKPASTPTWCGSTATPRAARDWLITCRLATGKPSPS
jgi:transposase